MDALCADAAELVRVPSVTGDERAVIERFARIARGRGLVAQTHVHDLAALRSDARYPGEEAARSDLFGAKAQILASVDRHTEVFAQMAEELVGA